MERDQIPALQPKRKGKHRQNSFQSRSDSDSVGSRGKGVAGGWGGEWCLERVFSSLKDREESRGKWPYLPSNAFTTTGHSDAPRDESATKHSRQNQRENKKQMIPVPPSISWSPLS